MTGIQDLLAAAQGAGVGGAPGGAAPMVPPPPADPMAQLQGLLTQVASSPQGGAMMQALTQTMAGAGGNGGSGGQIPNYTGPGAAEQRVKASGYEDSALDVPQGTAPNDSAALRMPGQKDFGGYLNAHNALDFRGKPFGDRDPVENDPHGSVGNPVRDQLDGEQGVKGNKPMSTEQELEMTRKNMGSGDPSENGDFPTKEEIRDLLGGYTSEKEFDAKWGKGAAQELYPDHGPGNGPPGQQLMGDYLKSKQNDDDGDHEYR